MLKMLFLLLLFLSNHKPHQKNLYCHLYWYPKLQMAKPPPAIPYHTTPMDPQPSTSTTTDYKSGPISLEMFNHAVANLNDKGVINMKKYKKYLYKPSS